MKHLRELENEIARLRHENRALVNSIFGLDGIPSRRIASGTQAAQPAAATLGSPGRDKPRRNERTAPGNETDLPIAPLRRRSWQQLGRAREIEDARAARRERETNQEVFPAPRNVVPRL